MHKQGETVARPVTYQRVGQIQRSLGFGYRSFDSSLGFGYRSFDSMIKRYQRSVFQTVPLVLAMFNEKWPARLPFCTFGVPFVKSGKLRDNPPRQCFLPWGLASNPSCRRGRVDRREERRYGHTARTHPSTVLGTFSTQVTCAVSRRDVRLWSNQVGVRVWGFARLHRTWPEAPRAPNNERWGSCTMLTDPRPNGELEKNAHVEAVSICLVAAGTRLDNTIPDCVSAQLLVHMCPV